ncbi:MAG TPA: hypothetical protein VG498_25720 [Terriglobales bacterium]|nr:hypothetical protein [Terriglobales bacterium]
MTSEIALHFPRNLDKPHVFTFPIVVVCLNCGFAEFSIPKSELSTIREDRPMNGGDAPR